MKKIFLTALLLYGGHAAAQIQTDTVTVYYQVEKSKIDTTFLGNGATINNFLDRLRTVTADKRISQIVFKAKNTNKNLTVDVKGVRIAKVIDGGDFTFPTVSTSTNLPTGSAATETDGSWGTWSLGTNKAFFKAGITESKSIGSTAVDLTSDNGALMLVPQAIKGWNIEAEDNPDTRGAYFLIDCKIASGDGENKVVIWPVESYDTNNDKYAEVAIPVADITWQQGKKYIYTFIFGEGGGYVPPTDDPDDPNPDPEPDPDPDDPQPEDPVLVPVTFTVTVDEFQNGNGDNVDIDMTEKGGTESSEAGGN